MIFLTIFSETVKLLHIPWVRNKTNVMNMGKRFVGKKGGWRRWEEYNGG